MDIKKNWKKFYGVWNDLDYIEADNIYVPKKKIFLRQSTKKFILTINMVQILTCIVRIIYGKHYLLGGVIEICSILSIIFLFMANKINKNIAFVLEVFAGFFFIIAIMVVVFF